MNIEQLNGEYFICTVYQQKKWVNLKVENTNGIKTKVAGLVNVDLSGVKGYTFNFVNGQPHFLTKSTAYAYVFKIINQKNEEKLSKYDKNLLKNMTHKIFNQGFTDVKIFSTIAYNFNRQIYNKKLKKELNKFITGNDASLLEFRCNLMETSPRFFLPEAIIGAQTNKLKAEFVVIDTYLSIMNQNKLYVDKAYFYKKCQNLAIKYNITKADIDAYFKSQDEQFFHMDKNHILYLNYKQLEEAIFNYFNTQKTFKIKKHTDGNLEDITLTDGQTDAVNSILSAPYGSVQVCSGGPGTGKTTSIRHALELASQKSARRLNVLCLAPIGAAKTVMNNMFEGFTSCYVETKTIHSFLYGGTELDGVFDYVIIDESSMIDSNLMAMLIHNQTFINAKTILMGDPKQLPSIGFGAVLRDIIEQDKISHIHLTEVKRQAEGSHLLAFIKLYGEECNVMESYSRQAELLSIINSSDDVNLIRDNIFKDDNELINILKQSNVFENYENSQIIAPTNQTINNVNRVIQNINKDNRNLVYKRGYKEFYEGDKVMFLKNTNTVVQNGTIGFIMYVQNGQIIVKLDSGEIVEVETKENNHFVDEEADDEINFLKKKIYVEDMTLGYCITVHKSQGGTWDNVLYIHGENGYYMSYNELLYTAFSRASKNLTIMCDINTLTKSITKRINDSRETYFEEYI